jgi:hypothetical protein
MPPSGLAAWRQICRHDASRNRAPPPLAHAVVAHHHTKRRVANPRRRETQAQGFIPRHYREQDDRDIYVLF